jgi:hypothetical protein
MIKRWKLYKIRKIRSIRDEALTNDNVGRGIFLLGKLSNVKDIWFGYHDNFYNSGHRINIKLCGGFTHSFSGYNGDGVEYVNEAILFAYREWLKSYLKRYTK